MIPWFWLWVIVLGFFAVAALLFYVVVLRGTKR